VTVDVPGYTSQKTLGRGVQCTAYSAAKVLETPSGVLSVDGQASSASASDASAPSQASGPAATFVVKIFRGHNCKDIIEREGHILRLLADLGVTNVPHFEESCELSDGSPAMALIETPIGTPLWNFHARLYDVEVSSQHICDLVDTLGQAHSLGFVHRDVKPDNIFMYEGRIILNDWGLVRRQNEHCEWAGTAVYGVKPANDTEAAAYRPQFSHDLVALVRSAYVIFFRTHPILEEDQTVSSFWETKFTPPSLWRLLVTAAASSEYDTMKHLLVQIK
jgi:serine/threonine protein kinase